MSSLMTGARISWSVSSARRRVHVRVPRRRDPPVLRRPVRGEDQNTTSSATSRTPASPRRGTPGPRGRSAYAAPPPPRGDEPGHGLVDAMMDSIPVVALTGQVTPSSSASDAFQEADNLRDHPGVHQAQLPREGPRGPAPGDPRGVLHRRQRRPGPVLVTSQGRLHGERALRAGRDDPPSGVQILPEGHAGQIAAPPR